MAGTLNSITITGLFVPTAGQNKTKYYIEIHNTGVGNAATYKWKNAGLSGAGWSAAAACSGTPTEFDAGLLIAFNQSDSYMGGIYPDTWTILAEGQVALRMDTLGWLENGGKRDLIGYDKKEGNVNIIKDFYGLV